MTQYLLSAGVLRHLGPRRGDGVRGAGGAGARGRGRGRGGRGRGRAGRHLPRLHPVRRAHQGLRLQGEHTLYALLVL